MILTTKVNTIREAWNRLHGVICIYKPAMLAVRSVRKMVINNIVRDVNQLERTPPRTFVKVEPVIEDPDLFDEAGYHVITQANLADLELVKGPTVIHEDIRMAWANTLSWRTSGVLVFGVNSGNRDIRKLNERRPLSAYQVTAQLGIATDNQWDDGKVWEKTTYHHLTKGKLDRVLASIQATNQKKMFEYCGIDPTTQAAYNLAVKGLLRPAVRGPTVLYSIKCVDFSPPNFTLEIHCINEKEGYFPALIHDLGLTLKTTAVCTKIRCIRYGPFTVDDALVRHQWNLECFGHQMCRFHESLAALPELTPNIKSYNARNANFESRNKN
nr:EOG090X0AGI [Moina brachiata]